MTDEELHKKSAGPEAEGGRATAITPEAPRPAGRIHVDSGKRVARARKGK